MEKVITKAGLDLLRRIIKADDEGKPLVVTFDVDGFPVKKFDVHAYELDFLESQNYIRFDQEELGDIKTPGGIYDHQLWIVTPGIKISAVVHASDLGRYVSEVYEKEDARYKETRLKTSIALWLSAVAIFVSILVAIFK